MSHRVKWKTILRHDCSNSQQEFAFYSVPSLELKLKEVLPYITKFGIIATLSYLKVILLSWIALESVSSRLNPRD